jgi:anti-sigma factor RsiW
MAGRKQRHIADMNKTKTTAYALNELHGKERDSFESDLAADADLQRELQSASRVADALEQIMVEPREGLEPEARERLIRAIAENQRIFHQRRKIVRFAVPVSLAAAASIAVLLWVAGGTTPPRPAMADGGGGRVFLPAESAAVASSDGVEGAPTNAMVPQKRVMPWDAKVLGADARTGP